MSGPKSYSVEVFDKNLKTLFLLQNEIISLWGFLSSCKISDAARKIEITCQDFLNKHIEQFQSINNPFIENFEGEINQGQFNKFYNQVHVFIEKQQKFKRLLKEKLAWFKTLEDDFKYYLETEKLLSKYREDFAVLKNQMLEYLDNLSLDDQVKMEKISDLKKANFSFELPPFTIETAKKLEFLRKELVDSIEESRKKLGTVSTSIAQTHSKNNVEENVKLVSSQNFKNNKQSVRGNAATINEIETLLNRLEDGKHKDNFAERLLNLRRNLNANNQYFFVELHEEIKKHIQQSNLKGDIIRISQELSAITFVSSMDAEIQKFKTRIGGLIKRGGVKQSDVENISGHLSSLIEKNQILIQKKKLANQERRYIKSRLVAALHDLNYDVVSDAKVIDLDSPDALLLQASDRQNFINLRFDDSGQLLYNYLIPEDRNKLSYDEQAIKLAGLEDTCNEFKKMLEDLQQQGLNIELKNEIPITEKALIRLPEKYRELIKLDKKKSAVSARTVSQKRKMGK